ncbi:hypothetical protein, partial [Klebsiella pneumoniae]
MLGGTLNALQGSVITGQTQGVQLRQGTTATGGSDSSMTLDGSTVEGKTGSAIIVRDSADGNKGT